MSWDDRNNWPARVEQALESFDGRGIPLPPSVAAAVKALRRIEGVQPTQPETTALRRAYLAGAKNDEITRLLLDDLGFSRLRSEWSQARIDSAGAALAAIRNTADDIMPLLQEQAHQAIDKLAHIAKFGAGIRLDTLVREGRADDARLLADTDIVASELDAVFELRDRFLAPGGPVALAVAGINCSRWRDPIAAAAHSRGDTAAARYISGLRAGLELWCPRPAEAVAAAQAIADRLAAERKRQKDREFGVGSAVSFA